MNTYLDEEVAYESPMSIWGRVMYSTMVGAVSGGMLGGVQLAYASRKPEYKAMALEELIQDGMQFDTFEQNQKFISSRIAQVEEIMNNEDVTIEMKEEIYSMLNENTLNKEEYMNKLLDMETPYTRSKENIDMLIKIYNSHNYNLKFLWLILIAWLTDIGGYIFGKLFGGGAPVEINKNAILIDVRSPAEYSQGHAVKALNWPLDRLSTFLEKNEAIMLLCYITINYHNVLMLSDKYVI